MPSWLWNSALSLAYNVAPRAADVLTFILVSRWLGPVESGIFSVASAYLAIVLATTRGLDDLLTREVAAEASASGQVSGAVRSLILMKLILAVVGVIVIAGLVMVMNYPIHTAHAILIMTLAIAPDSVAAAFHAYFQGRQRFLFPSLVIGGVSLARLVGAAVLVLRGASTAHIVWVWVATAFAGVLVAWSAAKRSLGGALVDPGHHWRFVDLRRSLTFLGITTLLAIEAYADVIVLERLRGASEVGWYRAATNIVFGLAVISQAYQVGIYPTMVQLKRQGEDRLVGLYQTSMQFFVALVLPIITLVLMLSPEIIRLVFGNGFQPAVPVLRILVVSLVFIYLSAPISRAMLVHEAQGSLLLFLLVGLGINVVGNVILGARIGARGAAWARLVSSGCFLLLSGWSLTRLLGPPKMILMAGISAGASLVMAGMLRLAAPLGLPGQTALGVCAFSGAFYAFGGFRRLTIPLLTGFLHKGDTSYDNP